MGVDSELSQDQSTFAKCIMWGEGSAVVEIIDTVSSFRYMRGILESHGEIRMDVEDWVAHASRAFGALCRPVFAMAVYSRRQRGWFIMLLCCYAAVWN